MIEARCVNSLFLNPALQGKVVRNYHGCPFGPAGIRLNSPTRAGQEEKNEV